MEEVLGRFVVAAKLEQGSAADRSKLGIPRDQRVFRRDHAEHATRIRGKAVREIKAGKIPAFDVSYATRCIGGVRDQAALHRAELRACTSAPIVEAIEGARRLALLVPLRPGRDRP